jgi:hypothetical protein
MGPAGWKGLIFQLALDRLNGESSQILPVASADPNALFGPVAKDLDLLTPMLPGNLGGYSGPIYHRLAYLYIFSIDDHQHIVQSDSFADVTVELLNFKNCARFNPILFATGSNHCVHAHLLCTASENSDLVLAALRVHPQDEWTKRQSTIKWGSTSKINATHEVLL